MSDDDVIDLQRYRNQRSDSTTESGLSLLGAEGPYRHLALPLWRMATLVAAQWAGLVRAPGGRDPTVLTAVDLASASARPAPPGGVPGDPHLTPPALIEEPDGAMIAAVARIGGDGWYVVLADRVAGAVPHVERSEVIFLAGECAALVAVARQEDDDQP